MAVSSPVLFEPTAAPRYACWSWLVMTGPNASAEPKEEDIVHPHPAGVFALHFSLGSRSVRVKDCLMIPKRCGLFVGGAHNDS